VSDESTEFFFHCISLDKVYHLMVIEKRDNVVISAIL